MINITIYFNGINFCEINFRVRAHPQNSSILRGLLGLGLGLGSFKSFKFSQQYQQQKQQQQQHQEQQEHDQFIFILLLHSFIMPRK